MVGDSVRVFARQLSKIQSTMGKLDAPPHSVVNNTLFTTTSSSSMPDASDHDHDHDQADVKPRRSTLTPQQRETVQNMHEVL